MPYVNIKITKEGGPNAEGPTNEQKAAVIKGVTDVLVQTLNKSPNTTFVVIDEVELSDWGIGGMPVLQYRENLT